MQLEQEIHKTGGFLNLDLLARQVVEGFISGLHKSPFHGFSAEFAEHKVYNQGESTRHIDWKLYAKTDKLYTKRYEEETNLRCHLILDNSPSMHYPKRRDQDLKNLNKIGFSVLASACLMQILKKQRDAVGLSIYSDKYEYYAPEKGSERHRQMLLHELEQILEQPKQKEETATYTYLHLIAEKIKRRSLIFFFSDMFQDEVEEEKLFEALRHLKYNKHELVLFHVLDKRKELSFDFGEEPRRFTDVETGEKIDLYADNVRISYKQEVDDYFSRLKLKCAQYGIKYVQADINESFNKILSTYLVERQKFV
ncbi:DUF58 domain-containing protein [Salinimicrobium sp. CAU 1759]